MLCIRVVVFFIWDYVLLVYVVLYFDDGICFLDCVGYLGGVGGGEVFFGYVCFC